MNYSEADQAYYEQVTREVQEQHSVKCVFFCLSRRLRCTTTALKPAPPKHARSSNLLSISQLAFRTCVHTFVHHQLTDKEEKCIAAVSKKFIASSLRATARLAEAQALEVSERRREMEARLRELKGAK